MNKEIPNIDFEPESEDIINNQTYLNLSKVYFIGMSNGFFLGLTISLYFARFYGWALLTGLLFVVTLPPTKNQLKRRAKSLRGFK